MENLIGVAGTADQFVITQAGSTIANFNYAEGDRIVINLEGATGSETLTNFDLINPFTSRIAGYPNPMTATAGGVVIRIPDFDGIGTQSFLTVTTADLASATALIPTLANNTNAFQVRSKGNTVVDWNDITVDAARMAGVPPAASTRYFALVNAAIYDAVQGIVQTAGRQSYLASQGITIAPPTAGANADVAAAAAARAILTNLFTDPNNPVAGAAFTPNGGTATTVRAFYPGAFTTALDSTIAQSREGGATQAQIDAGLAYGRAVATALLNFRQTDGYLLDANGVRLDIAAISATYKDGIENSGTDEAGGENNGTVGKLSNGTTLVGTADAVSTLKGDGTAGITSTAKTTPGVWRRAEDTLNAATGLFAGLASPEVAGVNQTWFLPKTSFFNDTVNSPPALDSAQYVDNVAEVKIEGSLLDLPIAGNVTLNNRSVTNAGVTSIAANSNLGAAINDTNAADATYPAVVGADLPGNLPAAQPDGIGTTSAERTTIAHVWANAEGSYGPNYAYEKIAQQLAINNNRSLADSAYEFAALNLALADGFANLWDAKWDEDYFWRPVSSIRNADQLAATASLDDNTWSPRENTPQHPCHPSGTSATAAIATTILSRFFGENQTFTVSADVSPNSARLAGALTDTNGDGQTDVNGVPLEEVSRTYTSFSQARDETRLSRIYAGAHFRFATEHGVELGTNVANYLLNNNPLLTSTQSATTALTPVDPATGVFRSAAAAGGIAQARWLAGNARDYEFGVINVDNSAGSIDGLTSDSAAYLAAALNRKQVIFSGRSNASNKAISATNTTDSELQSAGQLAQTTVLGNTIFYLTEGGKTTLSNVSGGNFASTTSQGLNRLTFKDSQRQDVVFEVGVDAPTFKTSGVAGGAATNVTVNIGRAASFNNTFGVYAVDDTEGCFDTNADGIVDLRVGATGYVAEAMRRAAQVNPISQATTNNTNASTTLSLAAGQTYGLFVIANDTVANFLAQNPTNSATGPKAYFSFTGANADGQNHVVRLGNGVTEVFGFEDQFNGGDRDFNDLIVTITKS